MLAGFGVMTGNVVALEPSGWDKASWGMTEREVGEVVSGVVPPTAKHETIAGYEGLTVPSYMMSDCECYSAWNIDPLEGAIGVQN